MLIMNCDDEWLNLFNLTMTLRVRGEGGGSKQIQGEMMENIDQ